MMVRTDKSNFSRNSAAYTADIPRRSCPNRRARGGTRAYRVSEVSNYSITATISIVSAPLLKRIFSLCFVVIDTIQYTVSKSGFCCYFHVDAFDVAI